MYEVLNVPIQGHEMYCVCAIGRKHSICRCDRHNVFLRIDVMLSENAKCNICPENRMVYICVTCILCFMPMDRMVTMCRHKAQYVCPMDKMVSIYRHKTHVSWIESLLFALWL
jgi:hypothetical protein